MRRRISPLAAQLSKQTNNSILMKSQPALLRVAATALLLIFTAHSLRAVDYFWTAGNNNWFSGANWSPAGGPPTAADKAYVNNSGTANIGGAGAVASGVTLGQNGPSTGTLAITGAGVLSLGGGIFVGELGTGTLNVTGGGTLTGTAVSIGNNVGSTGTATVSGAGSSWQNTGTLFVGTFGTGTLNITSGGFVKDTDGTMALNPGTSGTATVSGAGSKWENTDRLTVARGGTATLSITTGGTVTSLTSYIGELAGSNGTVTVNGAGSSWAVTGGLTVGNGGTGVLNIQNGGTVTSTGASLGNSVGAVTGNGTATVNGTGSKWTIANSIIVGFDGAGTLNVLNGGKLESTALSTIGFNMGAGPSAVTVSGAGSNWTVNNGIAVGRSSAGTLDITNGATVNSVGGVIAQNASSTSTATVDGNGSAWINTGEFYVADAGNGTLQVLNGGLLSDNNGYIADKTGSTGTATVDGVGSTWTNAGALTVGNSGTATLNITGGGAVTNTFGTIGDAFVGKGTVNVTGAGSKWTSTLLLAVGDSGKGTLNITNGGEAINTFVSIGNLTGSSGTATVTGAGSKWTISGDLTVGNLGTGQLFINNGGTVTTTNSSIAGGSGLSNGTATVDGAGSSWTSTADLKVGKLGKGTLNIQNGGTVGSTNINLGESGTGTVNVDGVGSSLLAKDKVTVGVSGVGALNVLNGGQVTNTQGFIGDKASSKSAATVSGAGSKWTTGTLTVGNAGSGALTLREGGVVQVGGGAGNLLLASQGGSSGALNIGNGGAPGVLQAVQVVGGAGISSVNFNHNSTAYTFEPIITGPVTVNHNGPGTTILAAAHTYTGVTNINAGEFIVNGSLTSPTVNVSAGGLLGGSGVLLGSVVNNGTVRPGHTSPGMLIIGGNYTQLGGGTLVIRVVNSSTFDRLVVGGSASLGGTLRVLKVGDYQPQIGDRLVFLIAGGGVGGTFGGVANDFGPQPGSLVHLDVVYEPTSVALVATQNSFENALGLTPINGEAAGNNGGPMDGPIDGRNFQSVFEGVTPNQIAVGLAIDSALFDPRLADTLALLNALPFAQVPAYLDKIAAEELTSLFTLGFGETQTFVLGVDSRLADYRLAQAQSGGQGDASPTVSGKSKDPNVVHAVEDRWGTYFNATGDFALAGDTANASGYRGRSFGSQVGIDVDVSDHLLLGLALQYSHSTNDLTDGGEIEADGGKLGLYSMYHASNGFFIQGLIGGGISSYDTRRSALEGDATGDTSGTQFDAAATVGWDIKAGGFTITPLAGLIYSRVGVDAFDEHGSFLPLHVDSQEEESLSARIGLRASYTTQVSGVLLTPSLSIQWQHEYGDDEVGLTSSFANGAGSPFIVHGPEIGRDSLLTTAGLTAQWSRFATYVVYQGDLARDNFENHAVIAGFRVTF